MLFKCGTDLTCSTHSSLFSTYPTVTPTSRLAVKTQPLLTISLSHLHPFFNYLFFLIHSVTSGFRDKFDPWRAPLADYSMWENSSSFECWCQTCSQKKLFPARPAWLLQPWRVRAQHKTCLYRVWLFIQHYPYGPQWLQLSSYLALNPQVKKKGSCLYAVAQNSVWNSHPGEAHQLLLCPVQQSLTKNQVLT